MPQTLNTNAKIAQLRARYYAGRIGQSSFYRRVAALIMINQRRLAIIH